MNVHILVGTTLGGTEYVADMMNDALKDHGIESRVLVEFDDITECTNKNDYWIICTSTHGGGELPENIQQLSEYLNSQPNLNKVHYDVIGIGDSSYDTFCQAAKTLDEEIEQCGAIRTLEPFYIDIQKHPLPEDLALNWLNEWYEKNCFDVDNQYNECDYEENDYNNY